MRLAREGTGANASKAKRLARRAVAPRLRVGARLAGRKTILARIKPPAQRGLVRSRHDQTHLLGIAGLDFEALTVRWRAPPLTQSVFPVALRATQPVPNMQLLALVAGGNISLWPLAV